MGRKRLNDDGLPSRVYFHHGAYIYKPTKGKALRLCTDRGEVDSAYVRLISAGLVVPRQAVAVSGGGCTITAGIKKYRTEVLYRLAPDTQVLYERYLTDIEAVFGEAHPDAIRPKAIYAFRSRITNAPGVQALITYVFRALYAKMIEWGMTDMNPAREVRCESSKKRTRVPDATDLADFKKHAGDPFWSCYIDFKCATGLRQKDILELPPIPLKAASFAVELSKGKRWDNKLKRRVGPVETYEIDAALRAILAAIYALPRPQSRQTLFCNARGQPIDRGTFKSDWRRAMARVRAEVPELAHFHEHDIRATTATTDPAGAQRRLGHKNRSTTDTYLRQFEGATVKTLDISRIPAKRP